MGTLRVVLWQQLSCRVIAAISGRAVYDIDFPSHANEHQQSFNILWSWILGNINIALWKYFIYKAMAAVSDNIVHEIDVTPS